jgi:hypothetical protein
VRRRGKNDEDFKKRGILVLFWGFIGLMLQLLKNLQE